MKKFRPKKSLFSKNYTFFPSRPTCPRRERGYNTHTKRNDDKVSPAGQRAASIRRKRNRKSSRPLQDLCCHGKRPPPPGNSPPFPCGLYCLDKGNMVPAGGKPPRLRRPPRPPWGAVLSNNRQGRAVPALQKGCLQCLMKNSILGPRKEAPLTVLLTGNLAPECALKRK